jgi:deoxyribose-phosphate aldolase
MAAQIPLFGPQLGCLFLARPRSARALNASQRAGAMSPDAVPYSCAPAPHSPPAQVVPEFDILSRRRHSTPREGRSMDYTYQDISKMIDHSLLKPTLTWDELERGCRLALDYDCASVCIMPYSLKRCAEILGGSTVKSSTTIGFPHGGHTTSVKLAEARRALKDGGQELDMVVNISKVLSGDWAYVREDLKSVIDLTHAEGQKVKVIFENCYLKDEHKIRLCEICGELGADWVKTSTGYGTGGATIEDLKLMRAHSPAHVQVKAAGGVRSLDKLLEVRTLGVTRVGASRTAEILDECKRRLGMA